MYDLNWVGGISVARDIAVLADAAELPTSTHSQGPVQLAASVHLAVHCPGCELVEFIRPAYYGCACLPCHPYHSRRLLVVAAWMLRLHLPCCQRPS